MHLIGLTGRAGAGKSTFARLLCNNYYELTEKSTCIIPFAKALKDLAVKIGWNGVKDERGRRLLQLLGTDICRNCIDKDYWVKRWAEQLASNKAFSVGLIIADDVRFENEIKVIKQFGGETYAVAGRAYDMSEEALQHESEKQLPIDVNFIIDNGSSIPALNLKALKIIRDLTGIYD